MYWTLKWQRGLPRFASKFAPLQFAAVVCKRFSDKVSSFAYRCHDLPERTEKDWNRQKRICESRNGLFIVKESRNFGNYIKIWSQIENKYGMSWMCWFQVFFNTLNQYNKWMSNTWNQQIQLIPPFFFSYKNMVPLLYRDGIRISKSLDKTKCGFLPYIERKPHFQKPRQNECGYIPI